MSDKQDSDSFEEKKASRSYNVLTAVLALLVVCAAGLNITADIRENFLTQMAAQAQAQSMLTQRIAVLISQYEALPDSAQLDDLKETVSTALVTHDTLEAAFVPVLPPALTDGANVQESLATLRRYVNDSTRYASAPYAEGAKEQGYGLIAQSRDMAALWNNLTNEFITASQRQIDMFMKFSLGIDALILGLLAYGVFLLVNPAMIRIGQQRAELERAAAMDLLSGTYNRAMLFKVAGMLISTYKRQQRMLSVLAIDIDGVKKVNELYGRAAGDALIKKVAATLSEALRTSDVIGRVGGGEFCVFLPSIEERRAAGVAEKLRAAIDTMPFAVKQSAVLITVSIGVAEMKEHHKTPDDLLRAAEEALLRAKEAGRNFVFSNAAIREVISGGSAEQGTTVKGSL